MADEKTMKRIQALKERVARNPGTEAIIISGADQDSLGISRKEGETLGEALKRAEQSIAVNVYEDQSGRFLPRGLPYAAALRDGSTLHFNTYVEAIATLAQRGLIATYAGRLSLAKVEG